MKLPNIESHLIQIIEGRKKAGWLRPFLQFASFGYRQALSFRDVKNKITHPQPLRVDALVISVGNIAVGGTGKTPVVQALARHFSNTCPVAILTRGYRSQIDKHKKFLRLSWEKGMHSTAEIAGDEAILLAQSLPQCDVWVGANRAANAERAVAHGAKILILDDAMQYTRLAKDYEIAVVDGIDPLGRQTFLPLGPLRDYPQRLRNADLVIVQRCDREDQLASTKEHLKKYTHAPLVGAKLNVLDDFLRGKKVGILCAIGNPQRFVETLQSIECSIVDHWFLRDHDPFDSQELIKFAAAAQAQGAECLVCTEKDIVKIPSKVEITIPIYALKVQWTPTINTSAWEFFINKVEDNYERRV